MSVATMNLSTMTLPTTGNPVASKDLVNAIKANDLSRVTLLISSDSTVDLNAWHERESLLVFASRDGNSEIVEVLLKAGARIDSVDALGRTACHVAALQSKERALAVLLAHRPNLNAKDEYGFTPLAHAFLSEDRRCVEMLIVAGAALDSAGMDNLCGFAVSSTSAIQALMYRGVVVRDLRDGQNKNRTVLHRAADMPDTMCSTCSSTSAMWT